MMEGGQMKGQWFSRCDHVTRFSSYVHGCSAVLWNATMSRMTGYGSVPGKRSSARGRGAGTGGRPRLTAQSSDCPTDSHLQVSSRLRCPSSCQHISGAPACEAASSDPFWKLFDIDCVCFLYKSICVSVHLGSCLYVLVLFFCSFSQLLCRITLLRIRFSPYCKSLFTLGARSAAPLQLGEGALNRTTVRRWLRSPAAPKTRLLPSSAQLDADSHQKMQIHSSKMMKAFRR